MKRAVVSVIIGVILIISIGGFAVAQTSANSNASGYLVNINGQSTGPYDTNGLKQLIIQGQMTKNSLVWKEGMSNWIIAGAVQELEPLFSSMTPPPLASTQGPPPASQAPAQSAGQSNVFGTDNYENFSSGQRWGTFWINWLVPGVGSFAIMHDGRGGATNMILGFSGYACILIGAIMVTSAVDYNTAEVNNGAMTGGAVFYVIGAGLSVATFIHNIVRSATYDRPHSEISLIDPDAWQVAMVPGKDGSGALALAYTIRY